MASVEDFHDQVAALETTLGGAAGVAGAFNGELGRLRGDLALTSREVGVLSGGIGSGLRRAFDGLVFDGAKLSDALRQVASAIAATIYDISMRPVQSALGDAIANGIGGIFGGLQPFADGAGFAQGRVMPFARGGVVTSPTTFALRGATGLMGEAGPEAILPLARGADGRLGVRAGGDGQPVTVVMNISTPDVQGFQRSQGQIAAQAQRLLARGQKNR